MSRYIDADALEYDTEWSEYHDGFTAYSQMAIDTAPSIDIVFCRECEYYKTDAMLPNGTKVKCVNGLEDYDYCRYGKRRADDE